MLIPKGVFKDFRGIRLVEVLCKATTSIINQRLTTAIKYHNIFHGFCTGRGKGTSTLETKLLHQMTAMREAILSSIFLDLQEAYDTLDWDRRLNIMVGYCVGPRTLQLLKM